MLTIRVSRLFCIVGAVLAVSCGYASKQPKPTPSISQVVAICESGLNIEAQIALRFRHDGIPKSLAQNMVADSMRKHIHVAAGILNPYVEMGKQVVANVYNSKINEKNINQAVYQACSKFNGANFTVNQVAQGVHCTEVANSIHLVAQVRDSGTSYAAATDRLKAYLHKLQSSHKLSPKQVAEENKIISKALRVVYANQHSPGETLSKKYLRQCLLDITQKK